MKLKYSQQEHNQRQLRKYPYQRPKTRRVWGATFKSVLAQAEKLGEFTPSQIRGITRVVARYCCYKLWKTERLIKVKPKVITGWHKCEQPVYKSISS